MGLLTTILIALTLGQCTLSSVAPLSIPPSTPDYATSARAAAIAQTRDQIVNGPRPFSFGGVTYPFYYGPKATPGSLTAMTQLQEVHKLITFRTVYPTYLASLVANNTAQLTSLNAMTELYHQASGVVEMPMSMDNSDETFGEQRTTIKSFALREAHSSDFDGKPLSVSDLHLGRFCGFGATSTSLQLTHALFVENFSTISKYNDPARPDKYVPNVVGFFCVHLYTKKLIPIEIRLLDSKLAYTPMDSVDEWMLAKMALEAASVSYHQMQHMAETHAVTIPLRVEALRTMSADHPVRVLLLRHVYGDFGLEMQVAVLLLNTSTGLDKTFGWGAPGATRFLYDQTQMGISMKTKAFFTDLRERGLDNIRGHKYVYYGTLYWKAMLSFVDKYIDAYYPADRDVVADVELQNWAKASASIPHVRDFPSSFQSKGQVRELLTHLIFTSTVRHHGMNGAATWHGMSVPYSPAALWKPLPVAKLQRGQSLNLLEYTIPRAEVGTAIVLGSLFLRNVPTSESIFGAYKVEPFSSEPQLQTAVAEFDEALEKIEKEVMIREADAKWPYHILRPVRLPHYTWV